MFSKSFLLIDNDNGELNILNKKYKNIKLDYKTENNENSFGSIGVYKKLKKDKIYFILEGEEFYIKLLKLPRVRKCKLEKVISNELAFIFKDINEFKYAYEVLSKGKTEISVLVFCINSDKNKIIDSFFNLCDIRGIYLLQLIIFDYITKLEEWKNGLFIFMHKECVYILASCKRKVIYNLLIRNFNGDIDLLLKKIDYVTIREKEFERSINGFTEDYRINLLNIKDKLIVNKLNAKYNCINLGEIDIDKIIMELR